MSADRELLDLAAKAAGAEKSDHSDRTPDRWLIKHVDGVWRAWNPLTDDGDALRLAVKLHMSIEFKLQFDMVKVNDVVENVMEFTGYDADQQAVRRAIVRAAAEIGRSMP